MGEGEAEEKGINWKGKRMKGSGRYGRRGEEKGGERKLTRTKEKK